MWFVAGTLSRRRVTGPLAGRSPKGRGVLRSTPPPVLLGGRACTMYIVFSIRDGIHSRGNDCTLHTYTIHNIPSTWYVVRVLLAACSDWQRVVPRLRGHVDIHHITHSCGGGGRVGTQDAKGAGMLQAIQPHCFVC